MLRVDAKESSGYRKAGTVEDGGGLWVSCVS
jgi:hypothetical protein